MEIRVSVAAQTVERTLYGINLYGWYPRKKQILAYSSEQNIRIGRS